MNRPLVASRLRTIIDKYGVPGTVLVGLFLVAHYLVSSVPKWLLLVFATLGMSACIVTMHTMRNKGAADQPGARNHSTLPGASIALTAQQAEYPESEQDNLSRNK